MLGVQTNISSCSSLLRTVASSQCCKHLEKEKEEVRVSLEEALRRLEEQHKGELVQLEDRCGFHLCVTCSQLDTHIHGLLNLHSVITLLFGNESNPALILLLSGCNLCAICMSLCVSD